jgi:hypothetical protein
MNDPQIRFEPKIHAVASVDLIVALDLLLRNAGTCLSNDQRVAVLTIIVATGGALHRAHSIDLAT